MKAAVDGILVLFTALVTHPEEPHGRVRAVVRQLLDDAEARTAIGAIGEGIAVAPVEGIHHLGQAIVTGGDVGENQRCFWTSRTRPDRELGKSAGIEESGLKALDRRAGRTLGVKTAPKLIKQRDRTLHVDHDPLRSVPDLTVQAEFRGEPVNKGAETDSLYSPSHNQVEANHALIQRSLSPPSKRPA
jgi:hypothetical protein